MRSFKEFKIKKSDKSINAVFNQMADEVAYLYTRNTKKITDLCSDWANGLGQTKFKTINEYKLLQELPAVVKLAINESATEARKLVNKARAEFFNEEETPSIFNSLATFTNDKLDVIFTNLHNDLVKNFGVYRQGQGQQGQGQGQGQKQLQPQGWMDRLKKWAKNAWHGPDYARMQQFAQQHGYQPESVEPENINVLFEDVLVESIELLTQILNTHKKEISDLVKQTLSHYDNFKRYGSYAAKPPEEPTKTTPFPPKDLGDMKKTDFPVVKSTPPSRTQEPVRPVRPVRPEDPIAAEPESSVTEPEHGREEPATQPQEPPAPRPEMELFHAKELPRRGEANLFKVNKETKELTFKDHEGNEYTYNFDELEKDSDGLPKFIPIGENEKLRVVKKEYKRFRAANRFALHHREEKHVEPEEKDEEKIKYIQELEQQGSDKITLLDAEDLRKIVKQDDKVLYKTNAHKIIPLDFTHPIEHDGFFYVRGAKYKGPMEKWLKIDKDLWNAVQQKINGKPGEEPVIAPKTDEFEGQSSSNLSPDPKIKGKGFEDIPKDFLF